MVWQRGTAGPPWLPSPTPLVAAILVSHDGGAREHRAWTQRAFMREQRDSPVSSDAQPAPCHSTAGSPMSPVPCGAQRGTYHPTPPRGGCGHCAEGDTIYARAAPWHWCPHELAVSQDEGSRPCAPVGHHTRTVPTGTAHQPAMSARPGVPPPQHCGFQ